MATGDFKAGTGLGGSILAQAQLTTGYVTQYTVPANTYVRLAKVVLCNTSGSATTVSYGAVKVGGTGGADAALQAKAIAIGASGSVTSIIDATELSGLYIGPGGLPLC